MPTSIIVQPSSIKGAYSSMLYQAYDTSYASSGFYYQYKVYVWSGTTAIPATPIATIQRLPDVYASNRSFIDISKIVTQYIQTEWFTIGASNPTISLGSVYACVKVQGIWSGGSSVEITSNVILATKGYEYTLDGFNQATSKRVLTDRSTLYLTTDTAYDYLWYDATKITSINIGATVVTPSAVTNSSNYIQSIELRSRLTTAGLWGQNCDIVFNYSGGSQTINVVFDCVNKYGCLSLFYKNRYGVIECLSMNALSKVAMTTTKENFYKGVYAQANMADAWSYGVRVNSLYNIQGVYKLLANTNWITESYVNIVQQILLSDVCYAIYDSKTYACQISDSSMDKKTYKNDKLIMYTMNFEFAQPLINSIVR
jgi:hypothetical protein